MEASDKKIQVAIVAKQFLYRLGVKTILSVIGIEPDILEFNDIIKLQSYLTQNSIDFAILSEDAMHRDTRTQLDELKISCSCMRILIMGEAEIKNSPCNKLILHTDNQKEVLDKLQDFFFEPEEIEIGEEQTAILSDREIDVLKNVALGFANKQIADNLFISINTVITHRKNITEKLGIKTIAGLTVYAVMNDLINPDEVQR